MMMMIVSLQCGRRSGPDSSTSVLVKNYYRESSRVARPATLSSFFVAAADAADAAVVIRVCIKQSGRAPCAERAAARTKTGTREERRSWLIIASKIYDSFLAREK